MIYHEGTDEFICLYRKTEYTDGDDEYSFIYLFKETQNYIGLYQLFKANEKSPAFQGYSDIYAPSLSGSGSITFYDISGKWANDNVRRIIMSRNALVYFTESVLFTEDVIKTYYGSGAISMADFGFNLSDLKVQN